MIEINGSTCQIDNMLLTKKALYVIEEKDYSGWIYGTVYQEYWRQTFAHYRSRKSGDTVTRIKFYNPIKQNHNHIRFLKEKFFYLENIPIKNIVVFGNDATLKNILVNTSGVYVMKINSLFTFIKNTELNITKEFKPEFLDMTINDFESANVIDSNIRLKHIERIREKYRSGNDN
ncbi:MAG: hypothetical protein CVV56_02100 [Tenericutes bacterium HGW-Tenericutes-1]|jgi:hypothetical protein|nr:MAG: hypothetical protein CVV56_02100 [Tenericutes bacterium HGW-Tenericutes-1]